MKRMRDETKKRIALLSILLAVGLAIAYFTLCNHSTNGYMRIEVIHTPNYIDLTGKVSNYSALSEIVKSGSSMEMSLKDFRKLRDLLNGCNYIKINESYYRIDLMTYVGVRKLNQTPTSFVNLIPEELENYPSLKMALYYARIEDKEVGDNSFTAEATLDEISEIREFIEKNGKILKYGESYYEVFFKTGAVFRKFLDPADCVMLDDEKLERYSTLKKGLKKAEKVGSVVIAVSGEELNRAIDSFGVEKCIEYNGSYYRVMFARPM